MTVKHTPAPWWTTDSGVRDRGGYICHTLSAQHYPGQEERFARETAERAANKALIAAAPDLLAVAQLLALATDEGDDLATGTHYVDKAGRIRCKGSFLDAIEKARAAIAKATGEQP
jgi:hypothetical protein